MFTFIYALVLICWFMLSGTLLNISFHIIIPNIIPEISLKYIFAFATLYFYAAVVRKTFTN